MVGMSFGAASGNSGGEHKPSRARMRHKLNVDEKSPGGGNRQCTLAYDGVGVGCRQFSSWSRGGPCFYFAFFRYWAIEHHSVVGGEGGWENREAECVTAGRYNFRTTNYFSEGRRGHYARICGILRDEYSSSLSG